MLLQSSNADILVDEIREELRVSSVHKYPGNLQSYKIVGAVTVAFFDWIPNEDGQRQAFGNNENKKVPTSLSFLHLPTNIHQTGEHNVRPSPEEITDDLPEGTSTKKVVLQEGQDILPALAQSLNKTIENSTDKKGTTVQNQLGNVSTSSSPDVIKISSNLQPLNLLENLTEVAELSHRNEGGITDRKPRNKRDSSDSCHGSCSSLPEDFLKGSLRKKMTSENENDLPCQDETILNSEENVYQVQIKTEPKSPVVDLPDEQDTVLSDKPQILIKKEQDVDKERQLSCGSDEHSPEITILHRSLLDSMSPLDKSIHDKHSLPIKSEQHLELTNQILMEQTENGRNSDAETAKRFQFNEPDLNKCDIKNSLPLRHLSSLAKATDCKTIYRKSASTKPSCTFCRATLQSRVDLAEHSEKHAIGDNCIKCAVCKKSFSHIEGVKRHGMYHFPAIFYTCPLCPRQVMRMDNFKRHFRSVHPGQEMYLSKGIRLHQKLKVQHKFSNYRASASRFTTQVRQAGRLHKSKHAQRFSESMELVGGCKRDEPAKFIHGALGPSYNQMLHQEDNHSLRIPVVPHPVGSSPGSTADSGPIGSAVDSGPLGSSVAVDLIQKNQGQIENRETKTNIHGSNKGSPKYRLGNSARKKDMKNFTCSFCQTVFLTVPEFMKHAQDHWLCLGQQFSCPVCLKVFQWEGNLKQHACNHVLSKLYVCPVCDAEVSRIDNFKRHITMCHQSDARRIFQNFDSRNYVVSGGRKDTLKESPSKQGGSTSLDSATHDFGAGPQHDNFNQFQLFSTESAEVKMGDLSKFNDCISMVGTSSIYPRLYPNYDPKEIHISPSYLPGSSLGLSVSLPTNQIRKSMSVSSLPQSEVNSTGLALQSLQLGQSVWPYDRLQNPGTIVSSSGSPAYTETSLMLSPDQTSANVQSEMVSRILMSPSKPKRPKLLQCLFCGARIFNEVDFETHTKKHLKDENETPCPICFMEYTLEEILTHHSTVHFPKPLHVKYLCPNKAKTT